MQLQFTNLKAFSLEDQRRLLQFYIQVFFSNAFASLYNNPEHTNFLFFAIDYLSNSDTDILLDNFEIIDNPGRGPSSYDPSPKNCRRSGALRAECVMEEDLTRLNHLIEMIESYCGDGKIRGFPNPS